MEKKKIFQKYSKFALILSCVILFIYIIVKMILNETEKGIYPFLFGYTTFDLSVFIIIVFITLTVSAIAVYFYKNSKNFLTIKTTIFSILFSIFFLYILTFSSKGFNYSEYISDEQKHSIIVRTSELGAFTNSYHEFYERTSFFTVKKLGKIQYDGNYYPSSEDFIWNENGFEIHWYSDDNDYIMFEAEYVK